jgi:hypothetical protein
MSLPTIVDRLLPLGSSLKSLDAAALQLSGSLPEALATFSKLEFINLSANKGLTGSLPSIWSALTALRSVDVSGTGISGRLPATWASLQELRAFRAADCSSLSGQLPLEWGILRSLQELVVTNSQLAGPLPAWTDPGVLRAARGTALATAQQAVDQADGDQLATAAAPLRVRYTSGELASQAKVAAATRALAGLQAALAAQPVATGLMPLRVLDLSGNKLSGQLVPTWSLFEQLQVGS